MIYKRYGQNNYCMNEISINKAASPRAGTGVMIFYGIGRAAEAIKSRVFETFLFFYYVQVLEVPGSAAGTAVGIALIFDALTDPVIGSYSDRFSSKWGRRHPFMLLSVAPLTISFLLLMIPPDGLSVTGLSVWLCVFAVLVRGSLTLFHVPYLSLAPELVTDYDQRTTLVIARNIMLIIGSATAFFVGFTWFFSSTPEFENGQLNADAYPPYAVCMAILMVICILLCVFGTSRHIPYLAQPKTTKVFNLFSIFDDLKDALRNKSFLSIFVGMLFYFVYSGMHSTMNLHIGTYFWELSAVEFNLYALTVAAGAFSGLPVAHFAMSRFDKKPAYLILIATSVFFISAPVILRLIEWFPDNNHPLFLYLYFTMTFAGLTAGMAAGTASASMVMDTTDEQELSSGQRQEGVFFGAVSFSGKAASALGHVLAGFVIDWIRFPLGSDVRPGSVSEDIIWELGFYYGPMVALLPLVTIYMVNKGYSISRKRHAEILAEIRK